MAALQYKDDHNRIAYLGRERGSEDFTDILSYLDHSPLRYALTHDPPVVFDSLVKQFWATATVRPNAAGSHDLVATIDGREVVVTESLIRAQLQLDDANGIFDMQIDDILAGMGAIGYPTDRTLTFLKHHLSPQWRFLVHTIMHCLSPKAGSWNQFPSSIATALICLSTGRVYNFSRFILEGMIANVKTKKNKFLMYPRFLQMLVAIETADRTPRPTFGFTRKLFSNMKFKWEGEEIPLTPPMLAIAAAGNDAADDDDAANEDNAAADEAAGSAAEAHPVPHSPPVSPVRELTPERQSASERPPSLSPTPPAQTFSLAEPLVFGPEPRPAGYVDPDVLEPIIFGPQPRPSDFVDPDLEEPVIFGPPPRPDNYIEPADIDNLVSMEDDTIHGGFHEESPVGPNDAPTPTADAAGRAEDPTLLTSLSAKLDRCMGRIDSLETELGTSKKIMGGAILTLVSRVKKLERTVKQLKTARFVGDAPATEGDVNIQDDVDLEGLSRMASEALGHDQPAVPSEDMEAKRRMVPLRRKEVVYRRTRGHKDAQARQRLEEELDYVSAWSSLQPAGSLLLWWFAVPTDNDACKLGTNVLPSQCPHFSSIGILLVHTVRENRRQKSFFYLKQLLPHVYREDLLLLRRRMNSSTLITSWDVVVAGNVIQTVQAGLRESYECLASVPIACTARQMVFSSPWLTAKKESGSPLQFGFDELKNGSHLTMDIHFSGGLTNDTPELMANMVKRNQIIYIFQSFLLSQEAVTAACFVAAGYLVSAVQVAFPAVYVSAGHVLVSAD
ncbi:hypothetical protein Tco_1107429 [Tanacetum coccineum]